MRYELDPKQVWTYNEGTNAHAYRTLGCHAVDTDVWRFALWAPGARAVHLVGDFNGWDESAHPMQRQEGGIYTATVRGDIFGWPYKYLITAQNGTKTYKADPFAFYSELRPGTASRAFGLDGYAWQDGAWMEARAQFDPYTSPINIYEVHLSSFKGELNYRDIAAELIPYLKDMHYTHVEFMPVAEYPFDGSWGYQVTGYYAVSARGGNPYDFMSLVDALHQSGIGVLLDWVPAHFPRDECGLRLFDGTPLYEYANPLEGEHPDWGTMVFDFGKPQVASFLVSNAVFWADVYHIDGLRVDAVSSMLYRSYGKEDGRWVSNRDGGAENYEAIALLQRCSRVLFEYFPGFIFAAEEATAFPLITYPTSVGGLGFNFKWNMGWMNDMLYYMELDPLFRKDHHDKLTFSMHYAFSENYILPLSHDEVVHGKKSLLDKMPGDYAQKFANLRVFLCYMYAHPGKKLLFMGGEFGQFIEWRFYEPLEWQLLSYESHRQLQTFVKELNGFYAATPALYQVERSWEGFEWINADDREHSVIAFLRRGAGGDTLLCVFNFTPVEWKDYRLGAPHAGTYAQVFSTDDARFGGGGLAQGAVKSESVPWNGREHSIVLKLPPLGGLYFKVPPVPKPSKTTTQEDSEEVGAP